MSCETVRLSNEPLDATALRQTFHGTSMPSDVLMDGFYVVLRPLGEVGRESKGRARWYGPFANRRVADMLHASAAFLGAMPIVPRSSATDKPPVLAPGSHAPGVADPACAGSA